MHLIVCATFVCVWMWAWERSDRIDRRRAADVEQGVGCRQMWEASERRRRKRAVLSGRRTECTTRRDPKCFRRQGGLTKQAKRGTPSNTSNGRIGGGGAPRLINCKRRIRQLEILRNFCANQSNGPLSLVTDESDDLVKINMCYNPQKKQKIYKPVMSQIESGASGIWSRPKQVAGISKIISGILSVGRATHVVIMAQAADWANEA